MTKEDEGKTVKLLTEYANFCKKELNDTICNIYLTALETFTFEEIKKAGTNHFTYNSFFPTPEQLKSRPTEVVL